MEGQIQEALALAQQVSVLTGHSSEFQEVTSIATEIHSAVEDAKQHKLKDMAHKVIDILSKIIPMVKSLVHRRQKEPTGSRSISTKSAHLLSILTKLFSLYSSLKLKVGCRSILEEVSVLEDALDQHVFEREIDESSISFDEAAKLVAQALGSEHSQGISDILLELKDGLEASDVESDPEVDDE